MSVISLQDVSWTYAGARKSALEHLNLEVGKGEAILVTGPAGAGKSSLCYCLNGIVPNFFPGDLTGRIEVEGHDPSREEIGDLSRIVGAVLEDYGAQLLQPTVIDDVAFALENFGFDPRDITSRVESAIQAVGLKGLEPRNPHTLSGGQQQLCAIASVIALVPGVYVLDEPISSLDPLGGEMVSRFLRTLIEKREHTFVIVEQRVEEFIPWVDRIVAMRDGRIVEEGPPFEVLNDERRWERVRDAGVNLPQLFLLAHDLRKKVDDGGRVDSLDPAAFPPRYIRALAGAMRSSHSRSEVPADPPDVPAGDPIVCVEHLWHVYEGGTLALRDANLIVHSGEMLAIVGQNGSGKTTLLKHVNGLLRPTRGRVLVEGIDTNRSDPSTLSRLAGLVFQHPDRQLFKLGVKDEVGLGMKRLGLQPEERARRIADILKLVGLEHAATSASFGLSLGERKRLALAAALSADPKIILVDEPTTGQDLTMKLEIMDLLRTLNGSGKTIILVTHDMDIVAKYARRVVVMADGKVLLDGPTREVLRRQDVLSRAHLKPPPVVALSTLLSDETGVRATWLTTEEAVNAVG
ncbi:MAG TPA: ATP-binding cassette domain-containing protein [Thermoplasmata archaeon]|jgi:energy-coupling factor transport system ATP-binding protein|nr:ATP-binding cassette domain-containing protein [Thermoplasmata archaeon]